MSIQVDELHTVVCREGGNFRPLFCKLYLNGAVKSIKQCLFSAIKIFLIIVLCYFIRKCILVSNESEEILNSTDSKDDKVKIFMLPSTNTIVIFANTTNHGLSGTVGTCYK